MLSIMSISFNEKVDIKLANVGYRLSPSVCQHVIDTLLTGVMADNHRFANVVDTFRTDCKFNQILAKQTPNHAEK